MIFHCHQIRVTRPDWVHVKGMQEEFTSKNHHDSNYTLQKLLADGAFYFCAALEEVMDKHACNSRLKVLDPDFVTCYSSWLFFPGWVLIPTFVSWCVTAVLFTVAGFWVLFVNLVFARWASSKYLNISCIVFRNYEREKCVTVCVYVCVVNAIKDLLWC